jgi:hypothetical protein
MNDTITTPQPTPVFADQPATTDTAYQQECHAASLVEERLPAVPTKKGAKKPPAKYTSITTKCRLLCPDGCGMQRVSQIEYLPLPWTVITLTCAHVRGEILPAKGISLEHINTPAGRRLIPPDLIAERVWAGKGRMY